MTKLSEHDTAKAHLLALLQDWRWYFGYSVSCNMENDIDLLIDRCRCRGFSILMDTLPDLGKLYEASLDSGYFPWEDYPLPLRRAKGFLPLMGTLIRQSFLQTGRMIDVEPEMVQATRSFLYLFKKVNKDASKAAKDRAVFEFCQLEEQLPELHPFWDGSHFEKRSLRSFYCVDSAVPFGGHLVDWMERIAPFTLSYGEGFWDDLERTRPKHGPGAVSDVSSRGDKYLFPSWPQSLCSVFPANGWATHLHDSADESVPDYWGEENPSSELKCVPKTLSKPRVIASEPTAMQYCQQALMVLLRKMVSRSYLSEIVDFTSQEKSREILQRETNVSTIDLSSASDRLHANVVLALFKHSPDVLHALRACRTRYCFVGELHPVKLKKFAAMGSAVTFPVQSMVYATAALSALLYEEHGKWKVTFNVRKMIEEIITKYGHQTQVFGDDIIVPTHARISTESLLETIGLKVNRSKSFSNDFKESCGMDVYKRQEVTPLYLGNLAPVVRRQDVASVVEVSNNAYLKGYWNLARSIEQQVPKKLRAFIPVSSEPLPSLRYTSFCRGTVYRSTKVRWNEDLQSCEIRAFIPRSSQERVCRDDWSDLLQYFIEARRSTFDVLDDHTHHCVGRVDRDRISYDVRWVRVVDTLR